MSTPSEQSDLNETVNQILSVAMFFMVMKIAMGVSTQARLPSEHKTIAEYAPVKKSTPVKPVPVPIPVSTPQSLFKPDLTPELRGRAVGWPRPGWVMKEVLTKERTLPTGAYVTEASTLDLYKTYVDLINRENKLRDKYHKLKGPTLHSFDTYFRFAEYLGLVEKAGYEQIKGGMRRTTYRITQMGREDDESWNDLCGTWKKTRDKVVFKLPRSMQHN
jgi:hypothetical protein